MRKDDILEFLGLFRYVACQNMDALVAKKLKEIVGAENLLDSQEARISYSYDATAMKPQLPEAVVRPSTAEQISEIVKLANEEKIPIVPRG